MDLANSEPPFKGLKTVESKGTSLQNSSDRWVGSANNHFKEADEERQHRSKLNLAVSINKVNSLQQAWPKIAVFEVRKRKEYRMNAGSVPPLSANKFLFHIINLFFSEPVTTKDFALDNQRSQNEFFEPITVPSQSRTFPNRPHDIG